MHSTEGTLIWAQSGMGMYAGADVIGVVNSPFLRLHWDS